VPNPVTGTLADAKITVSRHLRLKAFELAFTLYGEGSRSPHGTEALVGIDPDPWWFPDIEAGVAQTREGGQKHVSIGFGDVLRVKTGKRSGWEGETTFNQLTGGFGPFEAYYEEGKGERPFDTKTKTYGGSLTLGPLRLSGEQLRRIVNPVTLGNRDFFTNPESEETRRRIALEASYPLAGIRGLPYLEDRYKITAGISRDWRKQKSPARSFPHQTQAHMGAVLPAGPVDLGLAVRYGRIRGEKPSGRVFVGGNIKF